MNGSETLGLKWRLTNKQNFGRFRSYINGNRKCKYNGDGDVWPRPLFCLSFWDKFSRVSILVCRIRTHVILYI